MNECLLEIDNHAQELHDTIRPKVGLQLGSGLHCQGITKNLCEKDTLWHDIVLAV